MLPPQERLTTDINVANDRVLRVRLEQPAHQGQQLRSRTHLMWKFGAPYSLDSFSIQRSRILSS